jgi:hypothetical protein
VHALSFAPVLQTALNCRLNARRPSPDGYDAHLLAVIAADLEPVRTPTGSGAIDRDTTVMPPFLATSGMASEQEAVCLHNQAYSWF